MSLFSDNIHYLRTKRELTQEKVAEDLGMTRGRYVKYEYGTSEPPLDVLKSIAHYFHISIDILLSIDLTRVPMEKLLELPDNRILLPIAVDGKGENMIEVVPYKARMGYLLGYADPEYIESLQHISLPFLTGGKYRAFPVSGDSMPPHKDGSFIVGKLLDTPRDLKKGRTYIFLTRSEGITYKRLEKADHGRLLLKADNPLYEPYEVPVSDLVEIWEFACSIATEEFMPEDFELNGQVVKEMFRVLRHDISLLQKGR